MVFLGLEQPVAYGREQVFDPTTAQMVLNANRDYINAVYNDYQQARQDMKDFAKEYGDFLSPIAKDMEWYEKNVTGDVRNFINNLYAQGIDPLRSQEGRSLVARKLASMPTGQIAQLRQSAETAKEYLKSFDDDTNPELERFLGRNLDSWSTLGDPENGIKANGIWGVNRAAKYQDLNKYTSHIFDALKDSYIGTDKDHYDWYGVTEQHLYDSLTPDKLGGLLNTPLGQFHYQNAIKDLAAQGKLDPTEQEKMEQFRKNIVAANHAKVHQDRKINEIWKMQQEDASRMRAARASKSNPDTKDIPFGWTDRQKFNVMVSRISRGSDEVYKSFDDYIKKNNTKGKTVATQDLKSLLSQYYNATMADIEEGDITTANIEFTKGGRQENINTGTGVTKKVTMVSFENNQIRPTAYAQYQWAGKDLTRGSYTRSFAEYLHKNKVEGESMGTPTINHKQSNVGDLYEINKYLKVRMKDLEGWTQSNPRWRNDFERMGITKVTYNGKQYKPGQLPKNATIGEEDYAIIPTSRRIDERGTGNASIDIQDDKRQLGTKAATDRQRYYIIRDMKRYE